MINLNDKKLNIYILLIICFPVKSFSQVLVSEAEAEFKWEVPEDGIEYLLSDLEIIKEYYRIESCTDFRDEFYSSFGSDLEVKDKSENFFIESKFRAKYRYIFPEGDITQEIREYNLFKREHESYLNTEEIQKKWEELELKKYPNAPKRLDITKVKLIVKIYFWSEVKNKPYYENQLKLFYDRLFLHNLSHIEFLEDILYEGRNIKQIIGNDKLTKILKKHKLEKDINGIYAITTDELLFNEYIFLDELSRQFDEKTDHGRFQEIINVKFPSYELENIQPVYCCNRLSEYSMQQEINSARDISNIEDRIAALTYLARKLYSIPKMGFPMNNPQGANKTSVNILESKIVKLVKKLGINSDWTKHIKFSIKQLETLNIPEAFGRNSDIKKFYETDREIKTKFDIPLTLAIAYVREAGDILFTNKSNENQEIVTAGKDTHRDGRGGSDFVNKLLENLENTPLSDLVKPVKERPDLVQRFTTYYPPIRTVRVDKYEEKINDSEKEIPKLIEEILSLENEIKGLAYGKTRRAKVNLLRKRKNRKNNLLNFIERTKRKIRNEKSRPQKVMSKDGVLSVEEVLEKLKTIGVDNPDKKQELLNKLKSPAYLPRKYFLAFKFAHIVKTEHDGIKAFKTNPSTNRQKRVKLGNKNCPEINNRHFTRYWTQAFFGSGKIRGIQSMRQFSEDKPCDDCFGLMGFLTNDFFLTYTEGAKKILDEIGSKKLRISEEKIGHLDFSQCRSRITTAEAWIIEQALGGPEGVKRMFFDNQQNTSKE